MNDINTLRSHLFETIEGIKNKTIKLEEAKAIADISQVVINSAKVEVEYAKATGGKSTSGFLPENTLPGVTQHRLK